MSTNYKTNFCTCRRALNTRPWKKYFKKLPQGNLTKAQETKKSEIGHFSRFVEPNEPGQSRHQR